MPEDRSDSELLHRCAQGDEEAFGQLLERHQNRIFALISRYVRDPATAEDLCQDTFFKVWKYSGSFRDRSAFTTWLYRLAVNTCLNHRETLKKHPLTIPLPPDCPDETGTANDELTVSRRAELLHQAITGLPDRQRMALLLAGFAGRSYEEIAGIMDTSVSSVESLLFRARQNLAACLLPYKKRGEL